MTETAEDMVTLRAPRKAWQTLVETLSLDAQSAAFDPDLRTSIRAALASVEEMNQPYMTVIVTAGVPSHVSAHWDRNEALQVVREELISLRADEDAVVVACGEDVVFSWPPKS